MCCLCKWFVLFRACTEGEVCKTAGSAAQLPEDRSVYVSGTVSFTFSVSACFKWMPDLSYCLTETKLFRRKWTLIFVCNICLAADVSRTTSLPAVLKDYRTSSPPSISWLALHSSEWRWGNSDPLFFLFQYIWINVTQILVLSGN